jgi:hypothetical protein
MSTTLADTNFYHAEWFFASILLVKSCTIDCYRLTTREEEPPSSHFNESRKMYAEFFPVTDDAFNAAFSTLTAKLKNPLAQS